MWEETLECFGRVVKEACGGRQVVGAFWGYLIHNETLWGGQSFFRRMMDSPFIDFWASPFTYDNKNPGMAVTNRFLTRSLQAHGKLFFHEVDTTITSSRETQLRRQGMVISDPALDAEVLKREFAYTLTEGVNGWIFDSAEDLGREVRNVQAMSPEERAALSASVMETARGRGCTRLAGDLLEVYGSVEGDYCRKHWKYPSGKLIPAKPLSRK